MSCTKIPQARLKPRESATASSDNNGDDINDCPGCAETLAPVLNGMSTNQGRAVRSFTLE